LSETVVPTKLSDIEQSRRALGGVASPGGIGATLGLRMVEPEEGRVVFEGLPGRHLYNLLGARARRLRGDPAGLAVGCAVHSRLMPGQGLTTLELKVSYLKAMTEAIGSVRAEGLVVNIGRRAAFAEGKLTDANGRLYANAASTLIILDRMATA
jgi:hypothetical protein